MLVTRLRDGSEVKIDEHFAVARVQDLVRQLQERTELILVLCTGTFPQLDSRRLILYPGQILFNVVRGLGAQRIGVLTPAPEQRDYQMERWCRIAPEVIVEAATPHRVSGGLERAAARLAAERLDLVVMDCTGYTQSMKRQVQARIDRPVLLARSVIARVAAELL